MDTRCNMLTTGLISYELLRDVNSKSEFVEGGIADRPSLPIIIAKSLPTAKPILPLSGIPTAERICGFLDRKTNLSGLHPRKARPLCGEHEKYQSCLQGEGNEYSGDSVSQKKGVNNNQRKEK